MVKFSILNFFVMSRGIDHKIFLHLSLWEGDFKQRPRSMC